MESPQASHEMSAHGQKVGCVWQQSRSHGVAQLPIQLRHGLGASSGRAGSESCSASDAITQRKFELVQFNKVLKFGLFASPRWVG